jgi:hypothetical protein
MPNMMRMFTDGIEANKGRLMDAVSGLAADVSVGVNGGVSTPSFAGSAFAGGGGSRSTTNHITIVYQGNGRGGDDFERFAQTVRRTIGNASV